MLKKDIYKIGTNYNSLVKYDVSYNKGCIKDFVCANYIAKFLNLEYPLTNEQLDKLKAILNKLVQPSRLWIESDELIIDPILLEYEQNAKMGLITVDRSFIIYES